MYLALNKRQMTDCSAGFGATLAAGSRCPRSESGNGANFSASLADAAADAAAEEDAVEADCPLLPGKPHQGCA